MTKPTLVILAAGMGSRYGGLKQIDPIDDNGNKIIDFSISSVSNECSAFHYSSSSISSSEDLSYTVFIK